jgi:hypothetical protein
MVISGLPLQVTTHALFCDLALEIRNRITGFLNVHSPEMLWSSGTVKKGIAGCCCTLLNRTPSAISMTLAQLPTTSVRPCSRRIAKAPTRWVIMLKRSSARCLASAQANPASCYLDAGIVRIAEVPGNSVVAR